MKNHTIENEERTCRKCHKTFVPSFVFDFYPDGDDPKVGLCEQCLMEKINTRPPMREPITVSPRHAERICKIGQGRMTCSFLAVTGSSFKCLKDSGMELSTEAREKTMTARGDNCSGPPDFKPHMKV
jgi:hypothetical protein